MNGNTTYRHSLVAIGGIIRGRWQTTTAHHRGMPMRQHAHAWVGRLLMGGLVTLALSATTVATADDNIIHVNCNTGETLKKALGKADPGDTIRVTGTCHERVTITTDRITLDGRGPAVLDGGGGGPTEFQGVVTIDGARGVTIKDFIIQHGPGEGILGRRGAAFTVRHTTVQDNAGTGIAVDSSRAELSDVAMHNNAAGLDVFTGATAILRDAITAMNNGSGIVVNGQSILEIRGAQVQLNNNRSIGLIAGTNSQVAIFGFTAAQEPGSRLTTNGNGFAGIVIGVFCSFTVLGDQFFNSGANIITTANNEVGILLATGAIASPFGTGKFVIEQNLTGVFADAASVLNFVSSPSNRSAITGNGTDVDLKFGTRADFWDVTIGTIVCDATVLSRGSTMCPPSP